MATNPHLPENHVTLPLAVAPLGRRCGRHAALVGGLLIDGEEEDPAERSDHGETG